MDLPWHASNSMIQVKTLYHIEKQRFQTHPLKPTGNSPWG